MADPKRISRLFSLILRYRPEEFGLEVDQYGYASFAAALEAVRTRYPEVEEVDLVRLIQHPIQRRFEQNENGVRALYGHSFFVEMDGEPIEPPEMLYMSSDKDEAAAIGTAGITAKDRFYVHLSQSRQVAEGRGRRADRPCIVEVKAQEAAASGIKFYARGEVVLCGDIPTDFIGAITGLDQERGPAPSASALAAAPSAANQPAASNKPAADRPVAKFGRRPRRATR